MATSIQRTIPQPNSPNVRCAIGLCWPPYMLMRQACCMAAAVLLPLTLSFASWVMLLVPTPGFAQPSAAAASDRHAPMLFDAAQRGDAARIRALARDGADAAATDADGWTALMVAAIKGHDAAVKALIDSGAPVNAQARDGASALMLAAFMGHAGAVRTLLAAGADVALRNRNGHGAAELAQARGQKEVVALLARAPQPGRPAAPGQAAAIALKAEHLLAAPTPAEFPELPAVIYEHPAFRGAPPARVSVVEVDGKEVSRLLMQDGIAQRWSSGSESLRIDLLGGLLNASILMRHPKGIDRTTLTGISQINGSLFPLRTGNRLRFLALEKRESSDDLGGAASNACNQRQTEVRTQIEVAGRVPGAGFGVPGDVYIVNIDQDYLSLLAPTKAGGACQRFKHEISYTRFFADSLGVAVPHPSDLGSKRTSYTLRSSQGAFPIAGDAGGLVSRGQAEAAARAGDVTTLKRWLDQGMRVDPDVVRGAIEGEQFAALDLLLDTGLNPDGPERDGKYLWTAIYNGKKSVVERLLAKGADPNAGEDGLLHAAMSEGRMEIAKALVAAGADVNRISSSGVTPLWEAIRGKQVELAITLIDKGADPNRGDWGTSPSFAVQSKVSRGAAVLMQAMVKRGLDWRLRDRHGTNALDTWFVPACLADSSQENNAFTHSEGNDVVTVLLNAGARPSEQGLDTLRNLRGSRAANLASCQRLFSILRNYGIQP